MITKLFYIVGENSPKGALQFNLNKKKTMDDRVSD